MNTLIKHHRHLFAGTVFTVAILALACSATAQNLFVSSADDHTFPVDNSHIFQLTPGGASTTFASGLVIPAGLAFDAAGNLFAADSYSRNIFKFTPGGVRSTFVSGISGPRGLAFDSAGNLFVSQLPPPSLLVLGPPPPGKITKITPDGITSTFAYVTNPSSASLTFNSAGNLFVSDAASDSIYQFTPDGVPSVFASGLDDPYGLAFDSFGNLFEADYGSGNIYKFTPGGVRSTFASGLLRPTGVVFDSAGDLYVTDWYLGAILKYTPGGIGTTFADGFGAGNLEGGLAFQPVPEPSILGWLAVGAGAFLLARRRYDPPPARQVQGD